MNNFVESLAFLRIVASPTLIGLILGWLIRLAYPGNTGTIMGYSVSVLGFIIGIIWGVRVWRKQSTVTYMAKIMATPELDNKDDEVDSTAKK
ncbi:MAG: hypothetical protein H3C45_01185 [Bacteroidia bacterium]|nr:hypothetical protein [Bacteroidia bacterium]MCC7533992.1 hypothetical protein [Bacteroidia bacterium]MCZ2140715.1 hypothetical protein [Bacteroidia bacterium]